MNKASTKRLTRARKTWRFRATDFGWQRMLGLLLLGWALIPTAFAGNPTVTDSQAATEVAPAVFVIAGQATSSGPAGTEGLANIAFINGPDGVLVWNTGVSHRHGQELLATILNTVERPVRAAVISHAYQDVLFGWSAFAEIGIPVWIHEGAVSLMKRRCQGCIERLTESLGAQAMMQTSLVEADKILTASMSTDLIGQPVDIIDTGISSGPHDLIMFDRNSGTLFAGALVMTDQLLDLRDGKLEGWLAALDNLSELPVGKLVPDYGAIGDKESITMTTRYLRELEASLASLLERGVGLADAVNQVPMSAYKSMQGYDLHHGRNVQQLYLQMEGRYFQ